MEKQHRDVLVQLRQKIVDDLDVYNGIINPLTTEYVLRNEDVEKIKAGSTNERRAEILLDILPGCGPYAFDVFHRALKHHYSWLSSDIDKALSAKIFDAPDMGRISPAAPNLPPLPEMTVTREGKTAQLKNALGKLKSGGYLALHGMKGFGKSCLTANTLKDASLVKSAFNNKVYWIKFGYERAIEDEILIQLNFLYHQVRNSENINSALNSEPLREHLVHYLRNHFGKANHRNALLILDDVWSKTIVDVFDFHCKTLVITTDIDFLEGKHPDIIEMKDGFTEDESLGLFAKVLEIQVDELPPEAKKIHDECNGMPILIAMFAAHFEELKDGMANSQCRWKYYLNSLRNKDSNNKVIGKFLSKQEAIFDMCIDTLPDDAKAKYETLAIFSQDVNIMPKTLEILWDEEPYRVDEHMLDLCHKSLAAKHWNVDLKSYVYGVHDLLLCHLRRKMAPEKLRGLHRSFIEKYRRYCKDDFSKLPNDNYSFSYIGHHLEQSGWHSKFPKLYLNFDFIREKIYHTGLSDLLIDLKKYRKWIIGNDEDGEANVKDLEKFLENQAAIIAEHRRRDCLDLVQIGINHSTMGYISQKATELANANSNKLYVLHNHSSLTHHNVVTSEEVSTEGNIARFTDDENQILIGTYTGNVILWDCETRSQTVFSGHSKKSVVEKITVANSGDFFLTLCNGQVKLFLLREKDTNGFDSPVRSPRDKQPFWSGIFSDKASKDNSHVTFSIKGEKITDMAVSQDDNRIAVCTNSGIIRVWNAEGDRLYAKEVKDHQFEKVAFTRNGLILHLLDRGGVLKTYAEQIDSSELFNYVSMYNLKIENRKVILFQAVPRNAKSLIIVTEHNAIYVKWNEADDPKYPQCVGQVHSYSKQNRAATDSDDTRFTCATLTYDGQYIVTGDSKGFINVWDIDVGLQPIATFESRVNSLDTYWLEDGYTHLICGSTNRLIHRWTLELNTLPKSVRKPLFDAVMKPWSEVDIVAKETPENTIVIYNGDKKVAETEPISGTIVRLSLNPEGNKILFATDDGVITLFDQTTLKSHTIMRVGATPGIVNFVNINGSTVVACGEDNGLKVWYGKVAVLTEETGYVISIHTVDENCVATVARNGNVIFWNVHETNWTCIKMIESCTEDECLGYSCLSPNKKSLTVLKMSGEMIIYDIIKDVTPQIDVDIIVAHPFRQKLSCCEYSHNDCYLAIGLENGDISIFDIPGRCEVTRLHLHCNEIRQLHWSTGSTGLPILLSVNCDELAWWNIAPLLLDQKKQVRRSRMGISRSTSSPAFSPRSSLKLPVSQSLDSEMTNAISNGLQPLTLQPRNGSSSDEQESDGQATGTIAETYWKSKTAKQANRLALLSVVPLPPSCNSKICVSHDFSKFLSVDIHGSLSNFKLHNYM